MKTLHFSIAILLSMSLTSIAQQSPRQMSMADSLFNEGDIPGSITEYRKMLLKNKKEPGVAYKLACAYSIDNSIIRSFDSCFKYLNLAIELDTSIRAFSDPDLLPAMEDKRWKIFEDRLTQMLAEKGIIFRDPEYAKALWKLQARDQVFFNEIAVAFRKLGMRSSVTSALWRSKLLISRQNQQELDNLLSIKGWPSVTDVGSQAAMAAYLIVQHSDAAMQKKYLPDVKRACEKGELSWERYALMYDRMCTNENIPQRYGTHTRYNEMTRRDELYPLEDPSRTDEWRKEVGLEPLSDYLKKMNIVNKPADK